MTGDPLAGLWHELEEARRGIEALEEGGPGGADRQQTRDRLLSLHGETERRAEELEAFRQEIRTLVDRYRAIVPAEARRSAERGRAPAPPLADHLGSSTYAERGWQAIAAGDYAAAEAHLEHALSLSPNDSNVESLLGWARMMTGRDEEALATFQRLLAQDPDNALARVNLGYICRRKGIYGEAIEHLSTVVNRGTDRKAVLYATLYLGLVYLDREMFEDARSFFRRALELGPNLVEAHWEMGRSYYLQGESEAAAAAWRAGAETNRFNSWGERCEQAAARVERGEDPEAR